MLPAAHLPTLNPSPGQFHPMGWLQIAKTAQIR